MAYTRNPTWQPGEAGGTLVTDEALNHIEDGIFDAAADADTANAALAGKAETIHTHTSSQITDFTEAVQDAVAALLAEGTNVTLSYDDAGNSLSITAAGGGGGLDAEAVRDTIGVALAGVGNISVSVNDALDTITISTTATANDTDANLKARGNHTGTQTASTISDFATTVRATTASDTAAGSVELATTAEATTGTDTARAVTPAGLKAVADTKADIRTRTTVVYTTASLATDAVETGAVTMAIGYRLLKVETSRAARVRVYGTTAYRTADAARVIGTDPTGDHGLLLEVVTTGAILALTLSPAVDGSSMEASPSTSIPISVTNKGSTGTVAVTFTWIRTE